MAGMDGFSSSSLSQRRLVKQYPAIPAPQDNPAAMLATVSALKNAVDLLTGNANPNLAGLDEVIYELSSIQDGMQAHLKQVDTVLTGVDGALAQRTFALSAQVQGSLGKSYIARFDDVETARATADSALSQRATTLEATIDAAKGTATTLAAKITAVDQARIDGDGALASRAATIETTLGGHTATLNTYATSIDGLKVKFGVVGTINGTTGGFVFTGIGKNDGTATYLLEINANVLIHGTLIVDGTVGNPELTDHAATQGAYAQSDSGFTSLALTIRGTGAVLVTACYLGNDVLAAGVGYYLQVEIDGGVSQSVQIPTSAVGDGSTVLVLPCTTVHGQAMSAGSHSFAIRSSGVSSGKVRLLVQELAK